MSKAAAAQPASTLSRLWHKWRFHINVLLLLVPLGFMPKYFADASLFRGDSGLGERDIGTVQVGPWSLQLAELRNEAPRPDGPAGYMKSFNAALCDSCREQVKATGNAETAVIVGRLIAERGREAGVTRVAFDRSGFQYHGRVKALAEAARENGLKF